LRELLALGHPGLRVQSRVESSIKETRMHSMNSPPQAYIASDLLRCFEAGQARLIHPPKTGSEETRACRILTRTYRDIVGVLIADALPPAPAVTGNLGPTLDAFWRQTLGRMTVEDMRLIVALGGCHYAAVDLRVCSASGSLLATRWKPLFASENHLEKPHV